MSDDTEGITKLNMSNAKPAVEVLVRAFQNYPLLQYYFPNEIEREKISSYFLREDIVIFSIFRSLYRY